MLTIFHFKYYNKYTCHSAPAANGFTSTGHYNSVINSVVIIILHTIIESLNINCTRRERIGTNLQYYFKIKEYKQQLLLYNNCIFNIINLRPHVYQAFALGCPPVVASCNCRQADNDFRFNGLLS